jgi:uncharacterized protein (TIGR02118 family)
MIKLTFCLRRAPHLTWQEFSDYWQDVHAPLVRSNAGILGIRRYVQVRTLQIEKLQEGFRGRNGGAPTAFDGVAEVWVDSLDDLRRPTSPQGIRAAAELLEDERRFIDLSASPMWAGEELIIIDRED